MFSTFEYVNTLKVNQKVQRDTEYFNNGSDTNVIYSAVLLHGALPCSFSLNVLFHLELILKHNPVSRAINNH